jgi:trk system potassium uptake protein TrkA
MKLIICGAGQVGWQIAKHLASENNDITVIDKDFELVRRLTNSLDVAGVTGLASHPHILERAGAKDADMIIAVTLSDEVNMVVCQVAHSVFSIPRKIARVREQSYLAVDYSDLYRAEHMPVDFIISPEKEVANAAIKRLQSPAAFETESFLDGSAQLIGLKLASDCAVLETPLRQLSELFSTLEAIVVGIRRNRTLFIPSPEDQLFAGDEVYIFCAQEDVKRVFEIFGKVEESSERIIIIGGGNVGLEVALQLENNFSQYHVKIIEKNRKRAEKIADKLEKTIVLNGDGLDIDLLEEANIDKVDAVLAITDDDKTNMLSCTRAKASGCSTTIALVNEPSLTSLLSPMGVDGFISPKTTTVSSILQHIRQGLVKAVYSIGDAEAEVIEAQVLGTSSLAGQAVRDIKWPKGSILGVIKINGETLIPKGDTKIQEGALITIFALSKDIPDIEAMLQVGVDFF